MQPVLDHNQKLNNRPGSGGETANEEVFIFPATVAQHRFWLLDHLQPGNPALNVPLAARLSGRLDGDRIERAVNEVVKRHEILRTTFQIMDGNLVQIIHGIKQIPFARFDVTRAEESAREAQVKALMLQEGKIPFDLAKGPLFRAGLIRVRDDEHILMLTLHHIGSDGWSNGVVIREVAQLYDALQDGRSLPELPLQYADFAMWQQDWLKTPAAEADRLFWRSQLQGVLPHLNLPTDYPRQASRSNNSTIHTLLLPAQLTEALKRYCHSENLTMFMVFCTVYAVLLHRYSGQKDVTIGSPAANRNEPDLEGLIGLFSNPLLLRLKFPPGITLHGLLNQVKGLSLEVMEHQAYPFERVMEEVQPDSCRAGLQWLQAYLVFQKAFMLPQQMAGVTLTPLRSVSPGAMFDWMLGVLERAEGIRLQMEYHTDLFEQSTIDQVLHHFQHLLEIILTGKDFRLDELPLLLKQERQQLVVDWNKTTLDVPAGDYVHAQFEEQAGRTPQAPAFQSGDHLTTYAELNLRANQLAHFLQGQGLAPGSFVGLALEPDSVEFVISFLAVLKAGGCCVAFSLPDDTALLNRLMLDSRLGFLMTRENIPAALPSSVKCRTFHLDRMADLIAAQSGHNPSIPLTDEAPGWVAFTAHTRKGAIIRHHALAHNVAVARRELGLTNGDTVGFSLTEMLPALLSGAKLIGRPGTAKFKASDWWHWVRGQGVTVAGLPTTAWHELVKFLHLEGAEVSSPLRLLAIGGRPISPRALSAWQQIVAGRIRLLDRFLLAEAAGAIAFTDPLTTGSCGGRISLMRPAPDFRIYLLDEHLQPVPRGVPGCLYVGGDHLAAEYLPPAATPEPEFVPDPYCSNPANRLFKTSDTGRFLPGGGIELAGRIEDLARTNGFQLELCEIRATMLQHPSVWDAILLPRETAGKKELVAYWINSDNTPIQTRELRAFLMERLPAYMVPDVLIPLATWPMTAEGRLDYQGLSFSSTPSMDLQVMIRGVRVETAEIEKQLRGHSAVREAAVIVREKSPGDLQVVACLTLKDGASLDNSQLTEWLKTRLPGAIPPSNFVILEQFPLTSNGTVDFEALSASEAAAPPFVTPRNYWEQVLGNIWRDVFKLKRVGVTDNFFALGGHSMLAIRLISEINKKLKTKLHVPAFFQNPTIEKLAIWLDREQPNKSEPQLVSLQPGRNDGALFYIEASMGLCRLAELSENGPASFTTMVPFTPATHRAALANDFSQLPDLETMSAPHAELIKNHAFSGPCILAGHSFGGLLAFEVAHQLQRAGRRVDLVLLLDAWTRKPPWWQKLRATSWQSGIESIAFRSGRLWQQCKAKSARLVGRFSERNGESKDAQPVPENLHLPYAEIDWDVLSKIIRKARQDYRFRPLDTSAVLFRALDDKSVRFHAIDGSMGWGKLFKGGLKIVDCPGDHTTLLKSPNLQVLAGQIQQSIENLSRKGL